jgi:hypothetical protein
MIGQPGTMTFSIEVGLIFLAGYSPQNAVACHVNLPGGAVDRPWSPRVRMPR